MISKRIGRRKGSRNRGYFFRTGRGWFAKENGRFVPLTDGAGIRLTERDAEGVKEAYARHLLARGKSTSVGDDPQVGAVCARYLAHLKRQAGEIGKEPRGVASTFRNRGRTLFDFCYGLPGEFFCDGDLKKRAAKGDAEAKRIHDGYGSLPVSELRPVHIDEWIEFHSGWTSGGQRTHIQAVKRAFNFGVERRMISANPLKGYKVPKSISRVTYFTTDQERALVAAAGPAFAVALKVCIRTGARFGSEFAVLEARHVQDNGDRMEWVFKPEESKNKKLRIIRITDSEVIGLVRERLDSNGPIFCNWSGGPWTRGMLSKSFRRLKRKVRSLDADACMYTCRHTYAKRTLEGYWTGKPTSIKTLARLMGNTVQVCIDHYLRFSEADNEGLWGAA